MGLLPLYVAMGLLQAGLGLWVLLSRPRERVNQALGVLLILFGGSTIAFQLWREGFATLALVAYHRVGSMYEIPAAFLILLLTDRLFPPRRIPPWARQALLVGAALVTAGYAGMYFLEGSKGPPTLEVFATSGLEGWRIEPYPPAAYHAFSVFALEALFVALAARAATDPARTPLQRRQAAALGLGFGFLVSHTAGFVVAGSIGGLSAFQPGALTLAGPISLAAVAYAATRIPRAFEGRASRVALAALLLPAAMGVLDVVFGPAILQVVPRSEGYISSRVVWTVCFSAGLALAVLRYDVGGGYGAGQRRRRAAVAQALFGLGLGGLAAGVAVAALDLTPAGLGLAAVLLLGGLAAQLPWTGLRARIERAVLLDPTDADALQERVGIYERTLRACLGEDGRVRAGTEPALDALRGQLGLTDRDHALLLWSRGAAGGAKARGGAAARAVVAYRMALEAAADAGRLRGADHELAALRRDLGVSEQDHALLAADVAASRAPTGPAATSPAPPREGAMLKGRYRVVRELGRGGFGEAFLARDEATGNEVVLKRLVGELRRDAAALQRFEREARVGASLRHPRLVAVEGLEVIGADPYLVLEYAPGGSLADRLRERGPLPEGEALALALDALEGLAALHRRGIVHRDVKPGNVFLDAAGRAKVGDFTIAREVVSGETLGGGRGPVGTPAYMAPEQLRGQPATPASDLYALAATLHEALEGAPPVPVEGLSPYEATLRVLEAKPAVAARASPATRRALARGLAKDPARRFPSAEAMADALRGAARGVSPGGTPAGSGPRRPRPPGAAAPGPGPGGAS